MNFLISHYTFSIQDKYSEGHRVTRAEALALNRVRTENVRELARREWKIRGLADREGLVSGSELRLFQAVVEDIDLRYSFRESEPRRARSGSLEAEIDGLARAKAEEWLNAGGEDEGFDQEVERLKGDPEVIREAGERFERKLFVAKQSIGELLGEEG